MSTIQEIEDAIVNSLTRISPRSAPGSRSSTPTPGTGRSSRTSPRAGWMHLPMRPYATCSKDVAQICESSREPRFWHCYRHLPVEVQHLADAATSFSGRIRGTRRCT